MDLSEFYPPTALLLLRTLFALACEHHGAVVAFLRVRLTRVLLGGVLFTLCRFDDGLFGCEFAPPGLFAGDCGVLTSELLLLGVDPFEGFVGGVERLAVAFFCFSERLGQSLVRFGRVVGDLVPLVGGCDRLGDGTGCCELLECCCSFGGEGVDFRFEFGAFGAGEASGAGQLCAGAVDGGVDAVHFFGACLDRCLGLGERVGGGGDAGVFTAHRFGAAAGDCCCACRCGEGAELFEVALLGGDVATGVDELGSTECTQAGEPGGCRCAGISRDCGPRFGLLLRCFGSDLLTPGDRRRFDGPGGGSGSCRFLRLRCFRAGSRGVERVEVVA